MALSSRILRVLSTCLKQKTFSGKDVHEARQQQLRAALELDWEK